MIAEAALRLLGAFYLLAALAGLRRAAMSALLDAAIAAIAIGGPPEKAAAERLRVQWMAGTLVLVGLGGIALALLLAAAVPLFLLGAAAQAAWLLHVAPRRVDPWDPPDAAERAAGWRALGVHLAVGAGLALAWWDGLLRPPEAVGWAELALAPLLGAGLLGFAVRQMRLARPRPGAGWSLAEEPRRSGLLLMPGWQEVPLHDAATGEALPEWESDALLTRAEFDAAEAWLALWRDLADPDDPWRTALKDPADLARIEAAGRPILESLRARLGPTAVAFEPAARPRRAGIRAARVRVAAVPGESPLWGLDDPDPRPLGADCFGISVRLAQDLFGWATAHDDALDFSAEGRPLRWSAAERAAHDAAGRALAARLVGELAATRRSGVAVTFRGLDGAEEVVG